MPAPIVVGTDGSPPATAAVTWAAEEAARRSLALRIVHTQEPWSHTTPYYPAEGILELLAGGGKHILAEAAELARERRPGLQIETKLLYGPIAESLREQSVDAFEVVVGNRGFGGFIGLLLGAVGLRVAGHAEGPVVVVRGDTTGNHGEIVAGIDPAEDPSFVLDYAFDSATVRGIRLRVLHAWRLPGMLIDFMDAVDLEEMEQSARASVAKAVEPWRERYPHVSVVEDSIREHPVRALVEASANADLVVVGSRKRSGLDLMHLGSVGHGIVHHAHCPVAIVRLRT